MTYLQKLVAPAKAKLNSALCAPAVLSLRRGLIAPAKAKLSLALRAQSVFSFGPAPDNKVLVIVHIPKCAGTTLLEIVISHYPLTRTATNYREEGRPGLRELIKDRVRCYYGHFHLNVNSLPENFICASVMRDPVSRIVSHYYHVLRSPQHPLYPEIVNRGMSLLDYAESNLSIDELDNGQIRQLAGLPDEIPIDESVFQAACAKISKLYTLIGLTENLDGFISELCEVMGWERPRSYRHKNRGQSPDPHSLSADVIDRIRARNRWDQRLYEMVATGAMPGIAATAMASDSPHGHPRPAAGAPSP